MARIEVFARITSIQVIEQSTDCPYLGDMREEYDLSLKVSLSTGHWFYTPKRLTRNVAACPGLAVQTINGDADPWFLVGELPAENKWNGTNWERCQTYAPSYQKGDWVKIKGTECPNNRLNRVALLS